MKSGFKNCIDGILIEKYLESIQTGTVKHRSRSTLYYFKFQKEAPIQVDWFTYDKAENGDHVKLEYTQYTGTVLRIETIKRF